VVINNTSGIQTGDTFSLGVHATGDINYFVSEQDLGYDANGDGDMLDRIYNLATVGLPQLGLVTISSAQAQGTLSISNVAGTGGSPAMSQIVKVGTSDSIYLAYKWSALHEAQTVRTITLRANGSNLTTVADFSNIRLYAQQGTGALLSGTTPFATANHFASCSNNACAYTWTVVGGNLLPFTINPGTPVTVFIKADIPQGGIAKLGEDFYMSVANNGSDVSARGVSSGVPPIYDNNTANMNGAHSYIVPCQVVVTGEAPSNGSTTLSSLGAGTQLGRFKVTNNCGSQVTLANVKFTDSGSHTGTSARYTLLSSDQNSSNYAAHVLATSTTDFVSGAYAFNSIGGADTTINGGSFRYITLAITTVTSVASGDTFNMSVAALGDWKFSATEANLGFDGNLDGDLGDTITGLYVDGKPALGFMQKQ
jgi:hypothetical protein